MKCTIPSESAQIDILKGQKILVVEDEVLIAMEIQSTLEDGGAEVVGPAHTLSDAMEYVRSTHCSAAVLDMRIGRDLISPVARLLTKGAVPFIFYSGQPVFDVLRNEWPEVPVLSKPANARQLVQAVAALIHRGCPPPDGAFSG